MILLVGVYVIEARGHLVIVRRVMKMERCAILYIYINIYKGAVKRSCLK